MLEILQRCCTYTVRHAGNTFEVKVITNGKGPPSISVTNRETWNVVGLISRLKEGRTVLTVITANSATDVNTAITVTKELFALTEKELQEIIKEERK